MYKWLNDITDIKTTIALDRNYEAISLVLETYTMSLITDTYGYAPILKLQRRKWYFET
jgi:hypothetical protein